MPVLVRTGMNALFAAGDEVMLRIGRPTADPATAIELSHCLVEHGLRVPRYAYDDVVADGELVAFAVMREHPSGAVDWAGVGAMVAVLHGLDPTTVVDGYPTPPCSTFPWWDFDRLLAETGTWIDDRALAGLHAAIERHRGWEVEAVPLVLCHGDVHPGNVIQTTAGPVLLDWDLLCLGPAGWDHGPLMTWAERWGGEPGTYESFAAGYGRSFRDDPVALAVSELRLVAATLMRVRAGQHDPTAEEEAERRLRWWRGDPDAPMWRAS